MEYVYEYDAELEERINEIERPLSFMLKGRDLQKHIETLRLEGLDPGMLHFRAAPFFEITCVTIQIDEKLVADGKACEVYGMISGIDEDDNTFILYNRRRDNAETILDSQTLSLDEWPFCPCNKPFKVFVYLREKVRNLQIANGVFHLSYKNEDDYDRNVKRVEGECGFATVQHTSYQHAVVAFVSLTFRICKGGYANVYGTVSCHFGDDYEKEIILFKRMAREYVKVDSYSELKLSRCMVGVPAYSTLWVKFSLFENRSGSRIPTEDPNQDSHPIAIGRWKVSPNERGENPLYINFNKPGKIEVNGEVTWRHPYELFDKKINLLETDGPEIEEYDVKNDLWSALGNVASSVAKPITGSLSSVTLHAEISAHLDPVKQNLLLALPSASTGLSSNAMTKALVTCPFIEVFSVLIDPLNYDGSGIHGMVRIHDKNGTLLIFKKNNKYPELLSPKSKVLPTLGPHRSFVCDDFRIDVKLWDVQGRVLSKGYIEYIRTYVNDYIKWYDRRICSIIKGEHGYAAVHYSIFSSGAQALIKVLFFSEEYAEVDRQICGSIVAEYSNYDYSTYYDAEFFKSVLFKKPLEEPVHIGAGSMCVRSGFEVPLLKYVVSAPSDCCLMINVDLGILSNMGSKDGVVKLQGIAELNPFCEHVQRIDGENGDYILVSASWKYCYSTEDGS